MVERSDVHDHAARTRMLAGFRHAFYECLTSWSDALFELCDAVLCLPAPVASVPSLSLEPIFRRSHGSLYKALALGEINEDRLRRLLVATRPTRWPLIFAVDASTWDRCDAECSPERGFYYSASKHSAGQPIVAGWSYQWICQLDFAARAVHVEAAHVRIALEEDERGRSVAGFPAAPPTETGRDPGHRKNWLSTVPETGLTPTRSRNGTLDAQIGGTDIEPVAAPRPARLQEPNNRNPPTESTRRATYWHAL